MKFQYALLICLLGGTMTSYADSGSTKYYIGEAIFTSGASVESHPYIIERVSDKASGTITERVVSFQRGRFAENSSLMKIENNNFVMTESTGTVTGEGTLTGLPWKWTFLRAEFKVPAYKMRIVDYNIFEASEATIAGHKDFYMPGPTGTEALVAQEDVMLHETDQKTFEAKKAELLK